MPQKSNYSPHLLRQIYKYSPETYKLAQISNIQKDNLILRFYKKSEYQFENFKMKLTV